MGISKQLFYEMIHWLWLWTLAGIAIVVSQLYAGGQETPPALRLDATTIESNEGRRPVSFPDRDGVIDTKNATLGDVLLLNNRGDYKSVINLWKQLDISQDCATWKHVGIGAAQLRLESLDQAFDDLSEALRVDPNNAVAEYFMGRVYQAKSRQIPFWYEKDDESSFRLVVFCPDQTSNGIQGFDRGDAFLPQFKTLPFDKQAKQHFRLAIRLGTTCDLDRTIDSEQPRIRLASQLTQSRPVTVRDLLISLNEENYVEKARREVGERLASDN